MPPASTNDTSVVTQLLAHHPGQTVEERAAELLPQIQGAYSFVWMDEHTLYAARDPQGIRPLVLGRLERGWVIASETAALDADGTAGRPTHLAQTSLPARCVELVTDEREHLGCRPIDVEVGNDIDHVSSSTPVGVTVPT